MTRNQQQQDGFQRGNCTPVSVTGLDFSLKIGIIRYFLRSKDWLPLALSLLTMVLGFPISGPAAKADELPEQLDLELGDEAAAETQIEQGITVSADGEEQALPVSTAPTSTNEEATKATPNPAISTNQSTSAADLVGESSDAVFTPETLTLPTFHSTTPTSVSTEPVPDTPAPILAQPISPTPDLDVPLPDNAPVAEPLPQGTVRILTPESGVIRDGQTNLVVEYNADDPIQVSVNQNPIDPEIISQQERNATQNSITQAWYNIPLEEGENTITVQAGNGTPQSVQLIVEQPTVGIEITPVGDPRIPADNRSLITLQGRITNETGELINQDVVVTLTASAGEFVGADQDEDQAGFQVVARNGQFAAQLRSGLEAQKVRIRAAVAEPRELGLATEEDQPIFNSPFSSQLEAFTQVEFITNLRPSLVSGVINLRIGGAGTDFWGSRRDFLNRDLIDEGTDIDLTGAVFAIGSVGEWLFTGAYNSDRPLNETCEGITRLFRGPQFCEQQYPVYGDSSTVNYLTPSIDSVYARLERTSPVPGAESDYFMWGDYSTTEFSRPSQLFTATTRQLHGFKANYNLGNLQITALYSNDIEGFQRDTIQPNGTSGYYFLSRRRLVPGSENVFLETEDINRPGTVIERKPLNRVSDYEIDYDRGSLRFRRPILATELAFFEPITGQPRETTRVPGTTSGQGSAFLEGGSTLLVRRIVVTYQFENEEGDDTSLYAGRLQYNFSQDFQHESWIAATYLIEDQGGQDFELYGADFRIALGETGELIGEYAHSSDNSLFLGNVSGSAYRLEASSNLTPSLNLRAYYRSVEEGFRNNATVSLTPGQTRYGASVSYRLSPSTSLQAGYDYEENFGIAPAVRTDFFDLFNPGVEARPGSFVNNSLSTWRVGVQQAIGSVALGVDLVTRNREDRVSDVFDSDATQIVSHLGVPLAETLTFRAQNELNLSDEDPLYPNRTTLGLDWKMYPGVTVRLAHQFFDGGILGSDSITSLDTIVEHHLGENTTLTGRYSILGGFNEITGSGAIGLNHRWVIAPGLRVNLGYEHTFSNSGIATAAGTRFTQPYAVGQSASSLALLGGDVYSVGIEYTDSPDFKASARFEHRTGSGNNNTVFSIAAAGKLSPALTVLARYEQANFANQLIEGLEDTASFRLGLAYRNPNSDRWNALLRYEYRKNPSSIPESLLIGSGIDAIEHVFAAEAIFAPTWRWEFYGKAALRHSNTDVAGDFSNSTMVWLSQLRATYRLGYRVDLAVEGRWIGLDEPSFSETGFALEAGYYLTPDLRLAVGYSFGSVDDRDFTGYRSEGGPYFGLTFKVNELFGGFGRQRVAPPQQQESLVEPVVNQRDGTTSRR